ncbi:MAG: cbb3-type cytochrome c oxidase subunit 3 [Alphaproteobacteria bacterium]
MDYESMVVLSQLVALFFFMVMFVVVVTYVCWPGNREKFDRAAQLPFEQKSAVQKRKG